MLLIMACHDWSGEPLRAQLHRLQTTKTTQTYKVFKTTWQNRHQVWSTNLIR